MDLTHRVLSDQSVQPYRRIKTLFEGLGAYAQDGRVDKASLLFRERRPGVRRCMAVVRPPVEPASQTFARAIYGGPLFSHYGHFITESLARLWYAQVDHSSPILFSMDRAAGGPALKPWQQYLFGLLDLEDRIVPLTRTARVAELIVPEPGYEIRYHFARTHAVFLGRVPWRPQTGRKLWLSRSRLAGSASPTLTAVESAIARDGWQILYPETMPMSDQLSALAGAERIAGEQGTALHTVMFLKDCEGLRLDEFLRDPELTPAPARSTLGHWLPWLVAAPPTPPDRANANQQTICTRLGITLHRHAIRDEVITARNGPHVTKVYAAPEAYLSRLSA